MEGVECDVNIQRLKWHLMLQDQMVMQMAALEQVPRKLLLDANGTVILCNSVKCCLANVVIMDDDDG